MSSLNEKLSKLSSDMSGMSDMSDKPSDWKAKAQARRENRAWLKKSAAIAVVILDALKAQNLSQKDLAERMQVSPQQISKIVRGQENLTLETISNLEIALGIQIIGENLNAARVSGKKRKPAA